MASFLVSIKIFLSAPDKQITVDEHKCFTDLHKTHNTRFIHIHSVLNQCADWHRIVTSNAYQIVFSKFSILSACNVI